MNGFGSDVVSWMAILGGGAVGAAATAAFLGAAPGTHAPVAATTAVACSDGGEIVREVSVSTKSEEDPGERSTTRVLFYGACADDRDGPDPVRIRVTSKQETHLRHAPVVTTIERAEIDAVRERAEAARERLEEARQRYDIELRERLRDQLGDAERRLEEATERLAEARIDAGLGEAELERMERERAELVDRLRQLSREYAGARTGGGSP